MVWCWFGSVVVVVSALPTKEAIWWRQHIVFMLLDPCRNFALYLLGSEVKLEGCGAVKRRATISIPVGPRSTNWKIFCPQADAARTMHKLGRGHPDHSPGALVPWAHFPGLSAAGPSHLSRQRRGRSLSSRDPGRVCTYSCALRGSGCLPRVASSPPQRVSGEGAWEGEATGIHIQATSFSRDSFGFIEPVLPLEMA